MATSTATRSRRRLTEAATVLSVVLILLPTGTTQPADAAARFRARHYELRELPWQQRSNSGWYSLSSGARKTNYHHIHVWQIRLLGANHR